MSCFQCSTSAASMNESILPFSFSILTFFIFIKIFSKILTNGKTTTKKKAMSILILCFLYLAGLYICVELSPIEVFDTNIYSERM